MNSRFFIRMLGIAIAFSIAALAAFDPEAASRERQPVTGPGTPGRSRESRSILPTEGGSGPIVTSSSSIPSPLTWYGFYDEATGAALPGSTWTFDHGAPDPLEGWRSVDLTHNDFTAFRRVTEAIWADHNNSVPAPILSGSGSAWLGFFEDQADSACWKAGLGYGNHWNQQLSSATLIYYGVGPIDISFDYFCDTEAGYDFVRVIAYLPLGVTDTIAVFDGIIGSPSAPAHFSTSISPSISFSFSPFTLVFEFRSDMSWSDEDSLWATEYGPFGVDDISIENVSDGWDEFYDFEADLGGCTVAPPLGVGSCLHTRNVSSYTISDPSCLLDGEVAAFHDPYLMHPALQLESAFSPAIPIGDLGSGPFNIFAEYEVYKDMPADDLIYWTWDFSYYPYVCSGAGERWSPPYGAPYAYYDDAPDCDVIRSFATDTTSIGSVYAFVDSLVIPTGIDSIRFILSVISWNPDRSGNFSPIFDNIRVGISSAYVRHVPCNSYPNIQAAIDSAATGDTILVARGTYTGAGNTDLDFGGKNLVLMSEEGPELTIIDCEHAASGVIFQSGEDSTSAVCGLTIQNGSATNGGAVSVLASSSPRFIDCVFKDNFASGYGGGIYCYNSSPRFLNCMILGNSGATEGGGVYWAYGNALFVDCTISGNGSGGGGGLYAAACASVSFVNCRITGNKTSGNGGGLNGFSLSTVTIADCTIAGNDAGGDGGGIYIMSSTAVIERTILWGNCAGGTGSQLRADGIRADLGCCAIDPDGVIGTVYYTAENVFSDPVFCDPVGCENAPTTAGDYAIAANSQCTALNSPCFERVGAYDVGCDWGTIKSIEDVGNDQGRQVRIQWKKALQDSALVPDPITMYSVWRKIEPGLIAITLPEADRPPLMAPPAGNWDFVKTIPAAGDPSYNTIVETLCDSTIAHGQCYSTFFVRAHAAFPTDVFDSPPDSGYSIDNLVPMPPIGVSLAYNAGAGNELDWEPSPDEDFQYFRIYRHTDPEFIPGPGNVVHTTSDDEWLDPVSEGYRYHYKLTAVDFSGNESDASSPSEITGTGDHLLPSEYVLYQNVPNPFNPSTTIRFDTGKRGHVELRIYDVTGQLVRTLVDGDLAHQRHVVAWNGKNNAGTPVASGIYFYQLKAGGVVQTKKMVLLR